MDLNQKIIAGLLLAFFLITLLRIFRTPLRLALKLLMNTALGFLALWAVNATAAGRTLEPIPQGQDVLIVIGEGLDRARIETQLHR